MEYAFFPGCLALRVPHYELSVRLVMKEMGFNLKDIANFSCCPDPVKFKAIDFKSWLVLAARNLCLAENAGLDIITMCPGCTSTFCEAKEILDERRAIKGEVNKILSSIGLEYRGNVKVKHFLQVLYEDVGVENIKGVVEAPSRQIRAATHTGCHLLRPSKTLKFDDPLKPKALDRLIEALGLESVDYQNKLLCCGGSLRWIEKDVTKKLIMDKIGELAELKAEALVVVCPTCFITYDIGQLELGIQRSVPVLFYPQLLGIALGFKPEKVCGTKLHKVSPAAIIEKYL